MYFRRLPWWLRSTALSSWASRGKRSLFPFWRIQSIIWWIPCYHSWHFRYIRICHLCQLRNTKILTEENFWWVRDELGLWSARSQGLVFIKKCYFCTLPKIRVQQSTPHQKTVFHSLKTCNYSTYFYGQKKIWRLHEKCQPQQGKCPFNTKNFF